MARTPPLLSGPFAGLLAASRARPLGKAASGPERAQQQAAALPASGAPPAVVEHDEGSRGGGHEREGDDPRRPSDDARDLELLDPCARHAASLAPPAMTPLATTASLSSDAPLRARSLEELLPALVRRIAWAGDKHKGTVRLELGAGAHAGTTILVHADGGRVRVEVSGSDGAALDRLRARLDGRLRAHGLDVESVT